MKKLLLLPLLFISTYLFSQTDTIGVFIENNNVKKEIIPIKCTKTKYNALGGALTFGIANTNIKTVFSGNTSNNIANKNSIFYFYFPTQYNNEYITSLSVNPTMVINGSPQNFGVARLKSKSNTRELSFGKINIWSDTSIGVDVDFSFFKIEKIRNGIYRLSLNKEINKGEYAFVYIAPNGAGAFLPIYDFSIK